MYSYWHAFGLEPVVSLLMAAHVLIGSLFVLELTLAVVTCACALPPLAPPPSPAYPARRHPAAAAEYSAALALEEERAKSLRRLFRRLGLGAAVSEQVEVRSKMGGRGLGASRVVRL